VKITFKLYATLQGLLPAEAVNNAVDLDVAADTSLNQLIDRFKVPRKSAHLVLVNGHYHAHDQHDRTDLLTDGDVVAVWPPVAGG